MTKHLKWVHFLLFYEDCNLCFMGSVEIVISKACHFSIFLHMFLFEKLSKDMFWIGFTNIQKLDISPYHIPFLNGF